MAWDDNDDYFLILRYNKNKISERCCSYFNLFTMTTTIMYSITVCLKISLAAR